MPPAEENKGAQTPSKSAAKPLRPIHKVPESLAFRDVNDDFARTKIVADQKARQEAEAAERKRKSKEEQKQQEEAEAIRIAENAKAEAEVKAAAKANKEAEKAAARKEEAAERNRKTGEQKLRDKEDLRKSEAEKASHEGERAKSLVETAIQLMKKDDHRSAIRILEQAVRMHPDYALAWHNLGSSYGDLKDYKQAVRCYVEAVRLNANNSTYWNNYGNYDASIKALLRCLQLSRSSSVVWTNLGEAYRSKERFADAAHAYIESTRLNPESTSYVWFRLGLCLYMTNDVHRAISAYRRCIAIDRKHSSGWFNLGLSYQRIKDYPQAEIAFRAAVESNPADKDGWDKLGDILARLGRQNEANAAYYEAGKDGKVRDVKTGDIRSLKEQLIVIVPVYAIFFILASLGHSPIWQVLFSLGFLWILIKSILQYKGIL